MSTTLLLVILILLTVGIWLVAIASFWYGHELLKRQKEITFCLLPYLQKAAKEKATMQALRIDKDEPIEKYREITLPEQVHVSFTDKKEE